MVLSSNAKLLLVMIGSTKHVDGATRLQKYGLLVHKKLANREPFFDDWQPDKFGVFSKSLAKTATVLVEQGFVQKDEVVNYYGKKSSRFRITERGRAEIQDILTQKQDLVSEICGITQYYFDKPLKEVLADTYALFPEYTTNSTIKHEVNKNRIDQESLFEEEFETPFESGQKLQADLTNLLTKTAPEHVFNDEDQREKLAKQIGLKEIPKLDSNAFGRLSGILRNKINQNQVDSVEIVRTVRGS